MHIHLCGHFDGHVTCFRDQSQAPTLDNIHLIIIFQPLPSCNPLPDANMDRFVPTHHYQSTQPSGEPRAGPPPTSGELGVLIKRLRSQTEAIYRHSYDASTWLARGQTLAKLGYPELAVGDGWKAELLVSSTLNILISESATSAIALPAWKLGYRMGFWMSSAPEGGADAELRRRDEEQRDMLCQYLAQTQGKARRLMEENLCLWPELETGKYIRRRYPWMRKEYGRRDDPLVELINDEFSETGQACEVRRHAFGHGTKDTSDVLGIFATRDIAANDTILVDYTRTWGCNGPGTDGYAANLGGDQGCGNLFHPNAGLTIDLRWLRDAAGKDARCCLLVARMLLCCLEDGASHPLAHHLVARLTPNYSGQHVHYFSLLNDIALPNTFLRTQTSIDIFANRAYDTWVLFTIQARIFNNTCGNPMAECLMPLFSLFNHSCEPNVLWGMGVDHRTVTVRAARDVKEGEQLFVEYDGFMADETLEVRRRKLGKWLEGPCACTRCMREEQEKQQASERVDEKIEGAGWDISKGQLPVL